VSARGARFAHTRARQLALEALGLVGMPRLASRVALLRAAGVDVVAGPWARGPGKPPMTAHYVPLWVPPVLAATDDCVPDERARYLRIAVRVADAVLAVRLLGEATHANVRALLDAEAARCP